MSRKRNASPAAEEQQSDSEASRGGQQKKVRVVAVGEDAAVERNAAAAAAAAAAPQEDQSMVLVTPTTSGKRTPASNTDTPKQTSARRSLFTSAASQAVPVTPAQPSQKEQKGGDKKPAAKRKLIFGRVVEETVVQENVRQVYGIVRKLTGSIGGNGSHGPIYGELTMGSMQKMVNLMKLHTNFSSKSRFIDVGSGIGKPNLHVAQDPGVEFSYGIEVEFDRWLLGMNCLKGVMDAVHSQQSSNKATPEGGKILSRCVMEYADVRTAKTFDPFTHVYMFSIGFPPTLWVDLSEMWNRSTSPYLICYHGPKDIIKSYDFHVELVAKTPTSMHGSKEGHMGYIYKRLGHTVQTAEPTEATACDPFFGRAWERLKNGEESLRNEVDQELRQSMGSGPSTRTRRRRNASS